MMPTQKVHPFASVLQRKTLIAGYVILYVLVDWLSYLQGITPWNPQAGLTLALMMVAGPAYALWTIVAAFLAEVVVRGFPPTWYAALLGPIVIAGGYMFAAYLLRKRNVSTEVDSPEQVVWLVAVILPISLLVAGAYVYLFSTGSASRTDSLVRYWVGDLNGVLSVTPLLLAAKNWRTGLREIIQRRWEVILQFASGVIALWIRLGQLAVSDLIFLYPIFVPVVWVAFRWGVVGAALSGLIFQIALIIAANGYADDALLINMQVLAVTLGTTALLLGSVVSSRASAEARLRERDKVLAKANRFAVVGEFASALTHELNQPITALVSYLRASQILAAPVQGQDPRLLETLDKAAREAIRTSDVLRRLRDFYRGGTPTFIPVDIQEVTVAVLKTYEDRMRQLNVHLRDTFAKPLPTVMGDRTQIELILHNLLTNAIDAVADRPESNREIAVTASQRETDMFIAIEDSGAGVSPEIAANLFDPFVTTKPTGMGLGLAISRSLLRNHGGDLWTESSTNKGARFVVRMPLTASVQTAL